MLRELSGQRFRWAPIKSADVVGVGSLMQAVVRAGSTATIFGTGSRDGAVMDRPRGRVVSVRGPKTAAVLEAPDLPLGDPALAIQALTPRSRRTTGPVVLPHFRVFGTREGASEVRRLKSMGFRIVLPNAHPLRVADAIARADYVLTSSLHGLIFANGLGREVRLISFEGVQAEPDFKYDDHLGVFGLASDFLKSHLVLSAKRLPQGVRGRMEAEQERVADLLPARVNALYAAGALLG